MMVTHLKNLNSLVFVDKNQWSYSLPEIGLSPDVALLSAWEQDNLEFKLIEPLVKKLIELGCKYIVCAGPYSESLHDFVDDVISDMPLGGHQENGVNIMTTWHDTDTDDEVADFFLHATNVSNSLLVAFLDEEKTEDSRLKKAILNNIE